MILRAPKTIKRLATVLSVFFLVLGVVPARALGEPAYEVVDESNGLKIAVQSAYVDTGNLNPGDTKNSSIKLTNEGSDTLTLSPKPGEAPDLAEKMRLTIKDGDNAITDDETFRDAAEKGDIQIGRMTPGAEKILNFHVELPNVENDYQGASTSVKWVFTTVSSDNGSGDEDHHRRDDDGDGGPDEPNGPDTTIEDEPVPVGPVDEEKPSEPETTVTVEEEEIPAGPAMPDTGETSPLYFFAAGAFLAVLGYAVRKK